MTLCRGEVSGRSLSQVCELRVRLRLLCVSSSVSYLQRMCVSSEFLDQNFCLRSIW